ncbi:hypothetical protein SFRURICE_008098, partial [Spodoptera frugiperda]
MPRHSTPLHASTSHACSEWQLLINIHFSLSLLEEYSSVTVVSKLQELVAQPLRQWLRDQLLPNESP